MTLSAASRRHRLRRDLLSWGRSLRDRTREISEAGMTTAEYAIGTLAACTFAALLIAVIRSPAIKGAITSIITTALGMGR